MNSNQKLSYAIAAILSGSAAGLVQAAPAAATDTEASDSIQEITVTAQRRTENIQNVPITIQALTAETLEKLSVSTFDDYVRYLPNVTVASNGPGQGNIYMRGLSVGAAGSQSSGTIGGFPNVAIYLDEQSGQLPAPQPRRLCGRPGAHRSSRRPAGHAVRRRRPGRRGSLHHQQAQAQRDRGQCRGGLRHDRARRSEHRSHGGAQPAVDRRPVGSARGDLQRQARRLHRQRAGHLHPQGHRPRHLLREQSRRRCADRTRRSSTTTRLPPGHQSGHLHRAFALQLLYQINDDWNALLTQTYQHMDSQGVFYQMPNGSDGEPLQPLSVTLFNPPTTRTSSRIPRGRSTARSAT